MCEICGYTPCLPACPNSDEAKPIHHCQKCGDDLYEGDVCYDVDGDIYCEDCGIRFRRIVIRQGD